MTNDHSPNIKSKWYRIIFEADTTAGRRFDVVLLILIGLSVLLVMVDSVEPIHEKYKGVFEILEWGFTILFTVEYLLRIILVKRPMKYILSFYGLIDLLSILPTYLGFFFVDGGSLRAIRVLRLMRIFRVLKLISFLKQANVIRRALRNSRDKILVFLFALGLLVIILGTVMYIIEDKESGFTSIPRSIYWSIVTITTVGYGDIAPQTALGQTIASIIMILGYSIIAVPTGIVTSELNAARKDSVKTNTHTCPNCLHEGHEDDAIYCKNCGEKLP